MESNNYKLLSKDDFRKAVSNDDKLQRLAHTKRFFYYVIEGRSLDTDTIASEIVNDLTFGRLHILAASVNRYSNGIIITFDRRLTKKFGKYTLGKGLVVELMLKRELDALLREDNNKMRQS